MNFTVIWSEAAIQDLARIWMAATDRNAITAASNEIDPHPESRPATRR